MGISMASAIAGVIGWPVAHSLSPRLHNYWLRKYGIDGEYKPCLVSPDELESFIKTMAGKGFAGCNVTIPHKERVFEMLGSDNTDDIAFSVGAVNTLMVREGGKLQGTNTDVYGFTENIRHALQKRRNKAVIFGAGGATRAIGKALIDLGFGTIIITNRTLAKAEALRHQFDHPLEIANWEERHHFLADADLLVNATSLGMKGQPPLDIDLAALPISALVTDIVYTPLMTPLLQQAQARGNPIVDGLGMLLHQAVPGFKAWFDFKGEPEINEELRQYMLSDQT